MIHRIFQLNWHRQKAELSDKEKTITDLESAKQELAELNEKLSGELASESGKIDALNSQIAKLTRNFLCYKNLNLLFRMNRILRDSNLHQQAIHTKVLPEK